MTQDFSEHHHLSHDGLRLYYREFEASAATSPLPVLCLPGLTRNCRDFEALARRLARDRRVITPDLRGRGRSDYDSQWLNYQPQTYVADMLALLGTLALDRVVVIGTSLGGLVGMLLALAAPGRVAGLVLNDIGPEIAPEGIARIQGYVGQAAPVTSWPEAVAQARQAYGLAYPDFDDTQWRAFAHLGYREDEQGVPRADYDPNIRHGAQGATAAPTLWPLFGMLAGIPVLALRGEHSDILSAATHARMAREHPQLQAVVIPNRGHAPTLDEPDSVAAIEAFLSMLE